MSKTVYALLVGIDNYPEPVRALEGCKNDVRHVTDYLRVRVGDTASVIALVDEAATREAVVDAFRSHLGRAGEGDVALFAFSGHGSQELLPDVLVGLEASGKLQNLMLHDAGRALDGRVRWPLADKELRLLLESVAASGAHTVAVLDCCHSGDATRDVRGAIRQWLPEDAISTDRDERAMIEVLKGPRPIEEFLDGALDAARNGAALRHVALYACQSKQSAAEDVVGGERRGVFSAALLDVLTTINSAATYRDVLAAVRDRVQRDFPSQRPDLFPEVSGGAGDGRFLDGTVQAQSPAMRMTRSGSTWVVDAGSMHGLSEPIDGSEFRLACSSADGAVSGEVRVVRVQAASSVVEPVGWEPAEPTYRAVIVKVPRPLAAVEFVSVPDAGADTAYRAVSARLTTGGPDGSGSTFVRERTDVAALGLLLRVRFSSSGPSLTVERTDGSPAIKGVDAAVACVDPAAAADIIVGQLEHIARWERIREFGSHRSALADEVAITIFPGAGPQQNGPPPQQEALALTGNYTFTAPAGDPVYFWVRVTKRTARSDLCLGVLDMDDKFSCQALVESTPLLAATWDQQFSFVAPTAGTEARDWFRFIISEFDFRADAFTLPPIAESSRVHPGAPSDLVEAPGASQRGASVVNPASTGPDSCVITIPFVVRGV